MHGSTRRELVRDGIFGAVGAIAAASAFPADSAAAGSRVFDGVHGDAGVVQRLTEIEQLIAFAYGHVLSTGALGTQSSATVREFLSQERAHVDLLRSELARLGGTPPAPPSDVRAVSSRLASLGVPGSLRVIDGEEAALRYLIGVETLAEGAYYQASSKLSQTRLVVLAARVMGSEAQHWTALSGLLHAGDVYRAVPYPIVGG